MKWGNAEKFPLWLIFKPFLTVHVPLSLTSSIQQQTICIVYEYFSF